MSPTWTYQPYGVQYACLASLGAYASQEYRDQDHFGPSHPLQSQTIIEFRAKSTGIKTTLDHRTHCRARHFGVYHERKWADYLQLGGKPPETRPSLLFLDLPDPAVPGSAPHNLASASILDKVKDNNRAISGEFPLAHWGFYFNGSSDDWGSNDMTTLLSTVQEYLYGTRHPFTVDRQVNNAYARKVTLLLFLARIFIFKFCLNVPGSNETFTSARWTLLQVCPHVLYKDIFNLLAMQLFDLVGHDEPRISNQCRHQTSLRDHYSLQSCTRFETSASISFTQVTCGNGLSINTLFWIQSSGSGLKDKSKTFEFMEFSGWIDSRIDKNKGSMEWMKTMMDPISLVKVMTITNVAEETKASTGTPLR
ncbi:MAG: hypothetical protein J3Q66DRAFT_416930 [Benniella sp.]|nr:MAG: hypothetical protein J3Q66DRAFT_416930 [Benniella sp.]